MASGHGHGSMALSLKFCRLLIVLFNLAFIVAGVVLIAIGVYAVKDPKMKQLRPLLNPDLTSTYSQTFSNLEIFAISIIAIGGVLLTIGFLGCCGAIKGFRFLHLLYAFILGVIIIAEIAIVVVFIAYQTKFQEQLVVKLQDSLSMYVGTPTDNTTKVNPVSLAWDFAQFNLLCCGAFNKTDFLNAAHWDKKNPYPPNTPLSVPFTCCPLGAAKSWTELPTDLSPGIACATSGANAYSQGCYNRLLDIVAAYKQKIIIGGIIVGTVEVLAFTFALVLYCRKEDYNKV